ncbi:MAG: glycoside hydrolase family 2 TIM barrel-domain containing protein [Terriglobia bacterium]|jgi:beta-galactosidase
MKHLPHLALAILLSSVVLPAQSLRQKVSLNEDWQFERQVAPGSAIEWQFRDAWKPDYDDSGWSKVFLPHSWDQTAHLPWVVQNHWRGMGWYRKRFEVPALSSGQRVFLEFEGASQVAKVWVNGRLAGEHVGGYTGFTFDVTALVKPGQENLLALSVDDTNSPDIPPANETNIAIYGGIYRDVWMHITGPVLIPDGGLSITTPKVSPSESTVQVTTEVRNSLDSPAKIKVTSEVISRSGKVVSTAEQEKEIAANTTVRFEPAVLAVTGAELWSPDHPNLYTLRSRVSRDGVAADEISTPFGIRVMGYVPGKGYTINGEFINIHGVDRRQDYGYLGDALPDAISRRDMEIIKQLGANMIRTAHYIQDKSIVEAADELGLLVWEEVPNIKIYDYQPGPMTELGDSRYTRQYIDNCLAAMEEMIRRDRNHPSIIIWGIADDNTGYPYIQDQRELVDKAREIDPTRWTAGRVNPTLTDVRDPTNDAYYNFQKLSAEHPDWKWLWNEWGAFKNERGLDIEPEGKDRTENGVGIVSEYRRSTTPSEVTGAIAQEASWIKFEAMPWMASAKWEMFDAGCAACDGTKGIFDYYGPPELRPWGTHFNGGDYRGLSDLWRIPKASFWFVKAQWTDDPFVQIVGHWTWPGQEGKPKMIRAYSTCDEVELFLNGKSLGKRKPESTENLLAEWKSYGLWERFPSLPAGTRLRHAPFIWKNIPYAAGNLRAVGVKNGKQYVDERKTAGDPYQIVLQPDRSSMASDGRDAVRIVAVIADKDGVPVPSAMPWLTFHAEGSGRLLGTPVLDAVWGMAAINVMSKPAAGDITVTVTSPGLKDGKCTLSARTAN